MQTDAAADGGQEFLTPEQIVTNVQNAPEDNRVDFILNILQKLDPKSYLSYKQFIDIIGYLKGLERKTEALKAIFEKLDPKFHFSSEQIIDFAKLIPGGRLEYDSITALMSKIIKRMDPNLHFSYEQLVEFLGPLGIGNDAVGSSKYIVLKSMFARLDPEFRFDSQKIIDIAKFFGKLSSHAALSEIINSKFVSKEFLQKLSLPIEDNKILLEEGNIDRIIEELIAEQEADKKADNPSVSQASGSEDSGNVAEEAADSESYLSPEKIINSLKSCGNDYAKKGLLKTELPKLNPKNLFNLHESIEIIKLFNSYYRFSILEILIESKSLESDFSINPQLSELEDLFKDNEKAKIRNLLDRYQSAAPAPEGAAAAASAQPLVEQGKDLPGRLSSAT